jgi:hypothetical protein
MTDEQLQDAMRAKSPKQVMAEFLFALGQLVVYHHISAEMTDLALNFHGRTMRVDIAKLTDDGQHLEHWLLGLNANLTDAGLGTPVSLPTMGTVQ